MPEGRSATQHRGMGVSVRSKYGRCAQGYCAGGDIRDFYPDSVHDPFLLATWKP
jgi:hypothetical protein